MNTVWKNKESVVCGIVVLCSALAMILTLGISIEAAVYSIMLIFTILLAAEDIKTHMLSDCNLIAMAVCGVLLYPVNPFVNPINVLLGVLIIGGGLAATSKLTNGQLGMGDAKLFMAICIFLGIKSTFMVLLYALVISAILCLALITFRRAGRKTEIPFAPFVFIGIIIELFLKF